MSTATFVSACDLTHWIRNPQLACGLSNQWPSWHSPHEILACDPSYQLKCDFEISWPASVHKRKKLHLAWRKSAKRRTTLMRHSDDWNTLNENQNWAKNIRVSHTWKNNAQSGPSWKTNTVNLRSEREHTAQAKSKLVWNLYACHKQHDPWSPHATN